MAMPRLCSLAARALALQSSNDRLRDSARCNTTAAQDGTCSIPDQSDHGGVDRYRAGLEPHASVACLDVHLATRSLASPSGEELSKTCGTHVMYVASGCRLYRSLFRRGRFE